MGITRQSLTSSEENFRKNYRKAGIKVLRDVLINDMGFDPDDIGIKDLTKSEIIDIMEGHMDFNKGGNVSKKTKGSSDYRKGGMVLSTVDNRKRK